MFVLGKWRTICFPSNTFIYGISRDSFKNFNIRACEHMILGQLRMGARQAKNAPLFLWKPVLLYRSWSLISQQLFHAMAVVQYRSTWGKNIANLIFVSSPSIDFLGKIFCKHILISLLCYFSLIAKFFPLKKLSPSLLPTVIFPFSPVIIFLCRFNQ